MNKYKISYSYWDHYSRDGYTRLECGFYKFIYYMFKGMKGNFYIHRYNKNDGSGYIGRHVFHIDFKGKQ